MKNPVWSVNDLERQIFVLKSEFPDLADDEELLKDTLEGETNFNEVMEKLVTQVREQDMMATAVAARINALRDRQTRHTMRMNFYRTLIFRLMQASGINRHRTTEGNLSVGNAPEKVIITDESAIPDEFMRTTKEPNKTAIKDALKAGNDVSGATMSNGGLSLTIR